MKKHKTYKCEHLSQETTFCGDHYCGGHDRSTYRYTCECGYVFAEGDIKADKGPELHERHRVAAALGEE